MTSGRAWVALAALALITFFTWWVLRSENGIGGKTGDASAPGIRSPDRASDSHSPRSSKPRPKTAARPVDLNALATIRELRVSVKGLPPFSLVDDAGKITSLAAETLNLPADEVAAVQRNYDDLQNSMRELIASRLVELPEQEQDGVKAYKIPPFPEEGAQAFGDFLNQLTDSVGEKCAWELAKGLPVESVAGGFGKKEVTVKISQPSTDFVQGKSPQEAAAWRSMSCDYRDPETGKYLGSHQSLMLKGDTQFFGVFGKPSTP